MQVSTKHQSGQSDPEALFRAAKSRIYVAIVKYHFLYASYGRRADDGYVNGLPRRKRRHSHRQRRNDFNAFSDTAKTGTINLSVSQPIRQLPGAHKFNIHCERKSGDVAVKIWACAQRKLRVAPDDQYE